MSKGHWSATALPKPTASHSHLRKRNHPSFIRGLSQKQLPWFPLPPHTNPSACSASSTVKTDLESEHFFPHSLHRHPGACQSLLLSAWTVGVAFRLPRTPAPTGCPHQPRSCSESSLASRVTTKSNARLWPAWQGQFSFLPEPPHQATAGPPWGLALAFPSACNAVPPMWTWLTHSFYRGLSSHSTFSGTRLSQSPT